MKSEKIVVSDGVDISCSFNRVSEKPVLIFSHSLGADRSMWATQIEDLSADYSILQYDTRGHGASEVPAGAYSIDRLALDVLDMMDSYGIARANYCGLSLGGMIGQSLGARAPDRFESFIFSTTSAYMGPASAWQARIEAVLKSGMSSILDAVMERWFTSAFLAENGPKVKQSRSMFEAVDPVGYAGCCSAIRDMDLRALASLNNKPTLIIAGAQDLATPPDHARYLDDRYQNSELVMLDAGHLANVEQSIDFSAAMRSFLEKF